MIDTVEVTAYMPFITHLAPILWLEATGISGILSILTAAIVVLMLVDVDLLKTLGFRELSTKAKLLIKAFRCMNGISQGCRIIIIMKLLKKIQVIE